MAATVTAADITVTSATATDEAAMAKSLGVEVETPPGAETADGEPPAATDTKKATVPAGDAKAAEPEPDEPPQAGETAEQKAAREGRNKTRGERRLETFESRIAAKRRELGDIDRQIEDRRRALAAPDQPPRTTPPPTKADAPAAAIPAAPAFKFPTWDDWSQQAENEDKSHEDFIDARTDARFQFNQEQQQRAEQARAEARSREQLVTDFQAGETETRAKYDDYDTVLDSVKLLDTPATEFLNKVIARSGKQGSPILYYLGRNPEVAQRIMQAHSNAEVLEEVGVIKHLLKASESASSQPGTGGTPARADRPAPPATPPSRPTSDAPAPVSGVPHSASSGRSLAAVAGDDDDADAYIAQRGNAHLLTKR